MRVVCDTQGTQEWLNAKKGKFSASSAHVALMKSNTKTRRLYVEKLADDREGIPDFEDDEVPPWFVDGRYYESWARGWYAYNHDVDVRETGFVLHDDYDFIGCSPDGLIDPDAEVEPPAAESVRSAIDSLEGAFPKANTVLYLRTLTATDPIAWSAVAELIDGPE